MQNRKHKLPATIAGLLLIGLVGFKDTGIFVKEYVSTNENGTKVVFEKEENANIIRELDESYVVVKDSFKYEIPMDIVIRTTKTTQKYKLKHDARMIDKLDGNPIKILNKDEIVQVLKYEDEYGLFSTNDGTSGYIKLSDVELIVEETVSPGISKADSVLKNGELTYTLVKGEMVAVKNYDNGFYTIVDDSENEFKVSEQLIELKRSREVVSRGSSKRTSSVNKVIELAYEAIGKPYVGGDIGKRGYDCSGLTYSLYLNGLGIKLNRSSRDQIRNGVEVKKENLIPGDLVFFRTTGTGIGHVGLYIGDNKMIHASSGRKQVMISSLNETYYKTRYVGARRIINN